MDLSPSCVSKPLGHIAGKLKPRFFPGFPCLSKPFWTLQVRVQIHVILFPNAIIGNPCPADVKCTCVCAALFGQKWPSLLKQRRHFMENTTNLWVTVRFLSLCSRNHLCGAARGGETLTPTWRFSPYPANNTACVMNGSLQWNDSQSAPCPGRRWIWPSAVSGC